MLVGALNFIFPQSCNLPVPAISSEALFVPDGVRVTSRFVLFAGQVPMAADTPAGTTTCPPVTTRVSPVSGVLWLAQPVQVQLAAAPKLHVAAAPQVNVLASVAADANAWVVPPISVLEDVSVISLVPTRYGLYV